MKFGTLVCMLNGHRIERERCSGYWRIWCTRCLTELPIEGDDDANRAYGVPRDLPRRNV